MSTCPRGTATRTSIASPASGSRRCGPDHWLIDRGAGRFPFRSNSTEARLEAALAGWGLVPYAAKVNLPGLEAVALDSPPPATPFFVGMHRDLRRAPRMKAMARALAESFAEYAA